MGYHDVLRTRVLNLCVHMFVIKNSQMYGHHADTPDGGLDTRGPYMDWLDNKRNEYISWFQDFR